MKKARLENGRIREYSKLPNSDGNVIGGFAGLSGDKIKEHGFYDVVIPNHDSKVEYLGDMFFDEQSMVFTREVMSRAWSQSLDEMKESKIDSLKSLYNSELSKTDWIIVRNMELGQTTSQSTLDARQALRDEYNSKKQEINNKTTKKAVASYTLPSFI